MRTLNNDAEEALDDVGLPVGSGMKDDLRDNRSGKIWVAWLAGKPIAWSMLTDRMDNNNLQVGVYVHPDFRRNGIGKRLLGKAKVYGKAEKRPIVSQAWDRRGKNFYSENRISHTGSWDHGGWIEHAWSP